MGYSTTFKGKLTFKKELKAGQITHLNKFLHQDRRDIGFESDFDAYESDDEHWYHIDLELLDDFSGIKWNGAEKTYDMENIVNFIIRQMKKEYPDFELEGKLNAQGEKFDDRWELVMKNGKAIKNKLIVKGKK